MSRSVLQRRFRKETGRTLQEEVLNVRMKRARQLLAESDLTLAQITERAGFKYQEYFGAAFKARFDTTPAKWRRQAMLLRTSELRQRAASVTPA